MLLMPYVYLFDINHIYLSPTLYLLWAARNNRPDWSHMMDLIVNHKLLKFPIKCRESSWRGGTKILIDKYRHRMISLPLPLSTRQSVSQGPWVIVTLTGSFVDQSLVFFFKKVLGLHLSSELEERSTCNQEWLRGRWRVMQKWLRASLLCKTQVLYKRKVVEEVFFKEPPRADATYWAT